MSGNIEFSDHSDATLVVAGGERVPVEDFDSFESSAGTYTIDTDATFTGSFTFAKDDSDATLDYLGVPECPDCGERDAVQLTTGEWVCQNDECREVFEHDVA